MPSEIEISVNGSSTLTPTLVPDNTSTSYTWKSEDETIAIVSYGKVTGKKEGTTTISVTTNNNLTATCKVTVVKQNGRDDEEGDDDSTHGSVGGHDYVDLGLSVKWATCNVGATTPEGYGGYYAWGETTEKSSYTWSTYKYCDGSILNVYNIGSNIKGTSYDAAYVKWGSDWRMPTETEMGELISKCTFKEETLSGVDGYLVTGPNGSSIFFPAAGIMKDKKEEGCRYWTSTVHSSGDYGMSLLITKNKYNVISPSVTSQMRSFGLPIRAVTDAKNPDPNPISITLSSNNISLKEGETKQLTATVSPDGASQSITWSVVSGSEVASVSSSGFITAKAVGTATIRATSKVKSSVYSDCVVIVKEDVLEPGIWSDKTLTIGDNTPNSTNNEPYSNYYRYSTTQMLYTPTEIGKSGTISSIAFKVASASTLATSEVKVYLGHKSGKFSSTNDFVSNINMTLVYSGSPTLGQSTGWEELKFNQGEFSYNGTDNLVLVITKKATSYSKSLTYYYYSGSGYTLYRRNDSATSYADITNTSNSYTASTERPVIRMEMEPNSTYNIELSPAGYATFYDSQSAFSLPSGLSAQVVSGVSNSKITYQKLSGNVVPKDVPVMLTNDAHQEGTYTLTASESNTTYNGTNLLHGSDEATMTIGNGYHYKLSYGQTGSSWNDVFGWYWGAQNGAPFQIDGHKAWLVVPNGSTRAAGFTIDGDATEIINIESEDKSNDVYYNMMGRRILTPARSGLYIKNGKKVIIK